MTFLCVFIWMIKRLVAHKLLLMLPKSDSAPKISIIAMSSLIFFSSEKLEKQIMIHWSKFIYR